MTWTKSSNDTHIYSMPGFDAYIVLSFVAHKGWIIEPSVNGYVPKVERKGTRKDLQRLKAECEQAFIASVVFESLCLALRRQGLEDTKDIVIARAMDVITSVLHGEDAKSKAIGALAVALSNYVTCREAKKRLES